MSPTSPHSDLPAGSNDPDADCTATDGGPLTIPAIPTIPTILMDDEALDDFLTAAVGEYQLITPTTPLPCFALLLGTTGPTTLHVERVAFGRNARTTDPAARREFSETIVPRFGPAYENEHRAWWVDSRDLLKASREAEALGLELLGSIHMHPDWHRIGPPQERGLVLSERPTPMDRHVFAQTAWPINVICYLERRNDAFYHALAAWSPALSGADDRTELAELTELPLRIRTRTKVGA
ncbi:MPN domain-containing protein [Streptomyces sp. YKOK-I1]